MSRWQLPSDTERARQCEEIARWRAMAKPLSAEEIAELERVWSAPGIHQYKGMDASLVRRVLATLAAFSRTSD
jgi:hypothetical protein